MNRISDVGSWKNSWKHKMLRLEDFKYRIRVGVILSSPASNQLSIRPSCYTAKERIKTKGRVVGHARDSQLSISMTGGWTKFGRRAALKWRTPARRKKKSIPLRRIQLKGGARYGAARRVHNSLPFRVTRKGASDNSSAWQRSSYRPSRCSMDIHIPLFFLHPPSIPSLTSSLLTDSHRTPTKPPSRLLPTALNTIQPNEWRL